MSQTDGAAAAEVEEPPAENLIVCVSRALENAAWTLDEFCRDDDAYRRVWGEISNGARGFLARLVDVDRDEAAPAAAPGSPAAPTSPASGPAAAPAIHDFEFDGDAAPAPAPPSPVVPAANADDETVLPPPPPSPDPTQVLPTPFAPPSPAETLLDPPPPAPGIDLAPVLATLSAPVPPSSMIPPPLPVPLVPPPPPKIPALYRAPPGTFGNFDDPAAKSKGRPLLPGEYTFDEEAESIYDDEDDAAASTVVARNRAAHLLSRAAKAGLAPAQTQYGRLLQKGKGVEKDLALAATFFERAAAQGDVDATATLGVALLLGRGVPRDEKRAQRLLAVAAARGDANARRLVRCLESVDAINLDGLDSFDLDLPSTFQTTCQRLRTASGMRSLPEETLASVVAFVDLPTLAAANATSATFREACLRNSPQLEHSLVVKRFPLLAASTDAELSPPDTSLAPRELFRTYARFFEGAADEEAPELVPTEGLDNYTLALELEIYNVHNNDQRESVYVGTGTVDSTSNDKPRFEFAVPPGVFTSVDERLVNGQGWNVRAKIVAMRKVGGRLQHAKLYVGSSDDGSEDELYFEYESMPISKSSTVLRWHEQAAVQEDLSFWPALALCWTRVPTRVAGGLVLRWNAPSNLVARFIWDSPNDSNDMSVVDACLTLEHYVDWK